MKTNFVAFLILITSGAYAGQDRGGGDLCENRIQTIRNDIEDWIHQDGHKDLRLKNISADQYASRMLEAFTDTKIQCVDAGDKEYPVMVNGTPKECIFISKKRNRTIVCDRKKFEARSESDQYVLIHHEFAGITGIEGPRGDISDYSVSNQITAYLEDTIVKKLVIKNIAEGNLDWELITDRKVLGDTMRVRNRLLDNGFANCTIEIKGAEGLDRTSVNILPHDQSLIPVYRIATPDTFAKLDQGESRGVRYYLSKNQEEQIIMMSSNMFYLKDSINGLAEIQFVISEDEKRISKIKVRIWEEESINVGTLLRPLYKKQTTVVSNYECI